tara:strand:+ start:140 stop:337 length:198 start_codon:yes stop_codon:yes gene_type:complete
MNIGAILVLAKLFQDAVGVSPSVIGPPAPNDVPPSEIKPTCGPGKYAWQNPNTGFWFCRDIPKGR